MAEAKPTSTSTEDAARVAEAAKAVAARTAEDQQKTVDETMKRMDTRPTPTQEECNLAALGQNVKDKEPDGGEPDTRSTKHLEAAKPAGGGYQTRDLGAAPSGGRQQPHTQHRSTPPPASA